jgi:hypothetical protein
VEERTLQNTGIKHDANKPDLSIIPKAALDMTARAFMFGAQKYGRNNFRGGMDWLRMTSAAMRHITAWQEGENLDKESREHHIGHALACLSMLAYYIETGAGTDNRPLDKSAKTVQNISVNQTGLMAITKE